MTQRFPDVPWMHHWLPDRLIQRLTRFRWKWMGLLAIAALLSISCHAVGLADATATPRLPLSTRGAEIVDASGQSVLLRGVNWFGLETDLQVPHGLWSRDYKEMLAQIKGLGYNVIRVPYSVQAIRATSVSGIDFSLGSNQELAGKTPLEVLDRVIQEAQRQGLMILLDSHRLNNQRIPELWYGDGFTEDDWIETWKLLATRYRNQPNVIGADLKNEPHGRASWGTNDRATDWRLAAERAGNAILAINPNWLIVVEGVEKNVPGQKLRSHWQGGNLEGVARFPVRLNRPHKLVYSPHEYGPGVFNQPWFSEPAFPKNLRDRWETGFYYIARRKLAPILIGEFGGRQVDDRSKEGIWQRQLVRFLQENKLSFTYWSWNPDSSDTGGILQADWRSLDQPKQQLLSSLLPHLPHASSPPSLVPTATPSPTPALATASTNALQAIATIQSDWQTGFCTEIRVTNSSNTAIRNWQVLFQMNQAAINNRWNGTFSQRNQQYTVIPAEWAQVMQPQQTVNLGFCADKLGPDYQPKQVRVSATKIETFR